MARRNRPSRRLLVVINLCRCPVRPPSRPTDFCGGLTSSPVAVTGRAATTAPVLRLQPHQRRPRPAAAAGAHWQKFVVCGAARRRGEHHVYYSVKQLRVNHSHGEMFLSAAAAAADANAARLERFQR
jgi:hypothetical protein